MVQEVSFKRVLSGALVDLLFGGVKPILGAGIKGKSCEIYFFKFGPMDQEDMSFKKKVYRRTDDR